MIRLLLGLFLFLLIIVSIVGSIGLRLLRSIFGFNKRNRPSGQNNQQPIRSNQSRKEKIFKKSEGEYVDFEEISEDS